ncbi:MAG: hypothetical protein IPG21_17235 [Saprospiraceae bacterium]|nr:hypothetical protein [Candidatus Vicinibacter affinis]
MSSFRGIIQVDGYAVYDQLEYINGINIVSCWLIQEDILNKIRK